MSECALLSLMSECALVFPVRFVNSLLSVLKCNYFAIDQYTNNDKNLSTHMYAANHYIHHCTELVPVRANCVRQVQKCPPQDTF